MQDCLVTDQSNCLFIPTNITDNVGDASLQQTSVDFGNVPINTSVTKQISFVVDAGYLLTGASRVRFADAVGGDRDRTALWRDDCGREIR